MISIPCGLRIYDREIELTLEPSSEFGECDIYFGNSRIGKVDLTPELDAAITACIEYERSIGSVLPITPWPVAEAVTAFIESERSIEDKTP